MSVTVPAPALLPGASARRAQLETQFQPLLTEELGLGRQVSYVGNRNVPFLRLYRYKEAFSLSLADHLLDELGAAPGDLVFDPFAGMGTTLFAAMLRGLPSIGVDRLPIATFAAATLPRFLDLEPGSLAQAYAALHSTLDARPLAHVAADVHLIQRAFDPPTLTRLRQWRSAIDDLVSPRREVLLLLFLSILEATSYTSNDGQFPRLKPCKRTLHPDAALRLKVEAAEADLLAAAARWPQARAGAPRPLVLLDDVRGLAELPGGLRPTVLITSPPYANRYDYTRSYCLELCFAFVRDFAELRALRFDVLRSHIESRSEVGDAPVHPALEEALALLARRKLNNPRIVPMLTAYFVDMQRVIERWSALLAPGARVAVVVDNVRFDGEVIPVDLILSDLARQHGFRVDRIRVARYKGNSSQQMGRYGRELVRESILFWTLWGTGPHTTA